MVHDMYLVQVKTPEEATGPWDLYKVLRTIPGDQASSRCPRAPASWSAAPAQRGATGGRGEASADAPNPAALPALRADRPLLNRTLVACFGSPKRDGGGPAAYPPSAFAAARQERSMSGMNDLRARRLEMEQALEARQRELGSDHPDLAADLRELGRLAHELGDFADAQALLRRALALHTEALGAEHPETATDINHIGLVLHDLGDLDGAHAAFERALAIDEAAQGSEHPSVGRDANNLAGVLKDMGDGFSAREALNWALSIYTRAYGPDHPTTKSVARNRSLLG
jgi:tetratricopeptide (TPR) repeat protein